MMDSRCRWNRARALAHVVAVLGFSGCTDPTGITASRVGAAAVFAQVPLTAEIFAEGVVSDAREQWRITFTPDGHTAYFTSSEGFFPFTRKATIYETHLVKGEWTTPTVAPFSGHRPVDGRAHTDRMGRTDPSRARSEQPRG
jgi:hypothetical protein